MWRRRTREQKMGNAYEHPRQMVATPVKALKAAEEPR
jgi:hypothetical protein